MMAFETSDTGASVQFLGDHGFTVEIQRLIDPNSEPYVFIKVVGCKKKTVIDCDRFDIEEIQTCWGTVQ